MKDYHPSLLALIGWRMTWISLLFLAVMIAVLQTGLEAKVASLRNQTLEAEAREIAGRLYVDAGGNLRLGAGRAGDDSNPPLHQILRIADAQGRDVIKLGPATIALPMPDHAMPPTEVGMSVAEGRPERSFFSLRQSELDGEIHGVTLDMMVAGRPVLVQVATDGRRRASLVDDLIAEFFTGVSWLLIPAIALLMAVNLMTVKAELRPLQWAAERLAEVGPKATGLRVPEEGLAKEIAPFVESVNRALDRLGHGFHVQREFTADAAHELRTPLAVLAAHIDALPDRAQAASLREDVAAMARIVEQLLRIAQLETLTVDADERADLHAVALDVATMLAPLAVAAGKSIALQGAEGPVIVRGNAEALGQAVRNLVENALRHAPAGTTVEIEIGDEPAIRVADRGPGVPEEQRAQVFNRFWRARGGGGGAGLGLAVVARIAEAHGGTVGIGDAPGGGALFTLRLPPSGS